MRSERPAYAVIIGMFEAQGLGSPPVRLRDELASNLVDSRELAKIAARLGEGTDGGAAWESLEAILANYKKLAVAVFGRELGDEPNVYADHDALLGLQSDFLTTFKNLGPDPL